MFDKLGKAFIEATKYQNLEPSPQKQGQEYPTYVVLPKGDVPIFTLPMPDEFHFEGVDLRKTIEERVSLRRYAETSLSMTELSYLLWLTQGIKQVLPKNNITMRTVPSAGARHPFETYLSVNRVDGLPAGLYHFVAASHQLEQVRVGEAVNQELTEAAFKQQQVAASTVTFVWVAQPYRTSWRYGSRGYRYLFLDAGHVCQNLHLAAESIGCGLCAIAAYDDDLTNQLLGVDGESQFAIYMASLGKKIQA